MAGTASKATKKPAGVGEDLPSTRATGGTQSASPRHETLSNPGQHVLREDAAFARRPEAPLKECIPDLAGATP